MFSTSEPSDALMRAALFAGQAPSLHNSQPWHWRVGADVLDLRLDPTRILWVSDPTTRLAVLSCGAALHHARMHLAADGWHADVVRVPDGDDPDLLARLRLDGPEPPDYPAIRLVQAAKHRHTDRHATSGPPVDLHRVGSIRDAVRAQGADLTTLRPNQVFAVAEAAELAHDVEAADPDWQVEVATWVGGDRPSGTGVPATALPADPELLTAPAHVLRRAGSALIARPYRYPAVFTVLHTAGDDRSDWVVAGEGLSAGWLTATHLDIAVLPLSVVTEVASGRNRIRRLLDRSGYPHLVLRLAAAVGVPAAAATPRLPADAFISPA